MKPIVSVIIPVYNEGERIGNTIRGLIAVDVVDSIIVVDDGSKDGTVEEVKKFKEVNLLQHGVNQGKGTALQTGVKEAMKIGDIIVFLDGDLGESSKEVYKLVLPLLNNEADVVIGRFPPAKKKGGFGLVKGLVRLGLKLHTGKVVISALSGQRAFKKEVLQQVPVKDQGYGIEIGMTIDLLRKNFKIIEVEVDMTHHETGRDLAGFRHRGKQFYQIMKVIVKKAFVEP
ncbi:glycosyltransferase family 2 protein [Alkaliphilus hydrothermalis]|uniref:Glucosyl-3-phosphoglycerate synthase n=1 Tax=Alkaliphilus hydrothermalis TaxID=1482730 RepID=A0ABS2NM79_9FIRM|nr:glycosyltransferase family 2 protein [Alkaliphilus hydrothermalis]MBM7614021.1 hypothetical protein [Alkaliphilus hydrothermalis]